MAAAMKLLSAVAVICGLWALARASRLLRRGAAKTYLRQLNKQKAPTLSAAKTTAWHLTHFVSGYASGGVVEAPFRGTVSGMKGEGLTVDLLITDYDLRPLSGMDVLSAVLERLALTSGASGIHDLSSESLASSAGRTVTTLLPFPREEMRAA